MLTTIVVPLFGLTLSICYSISLGSDCLNLEFDESSNGSLHLVQQRVRASSKHTSQRKAILSGSSFRPQASAAGGFDRLVNDPKGGPRPCWEYLWIGHANSSTIGTGVTEDFKSFASSVQRLTGRGRFVYYLDTKRGVDVGLIGSGHAQQLPASDLAVQHHFSSLVLKGIPSLVHEAMKPISHADKTCQLVASYSGHGYNFNGVGYQDHQFLPWQDLFGAITSSFAGPVDLLTLNSCRTADYMILGQVQGSAKMVLASQQASLFGYAGSWSYSFLESAKDASDFAKRTLHQSMSIQKSYGQDVTGISLIDMHRFSEFVQSFEKLLDWLQQRMQQEIKYLMQARRSTYEFFGPSLYEPDNAGMMVDVGSFLSSLRSVIPSESATLHELIDAAIQKLRYAIIDEEHFPPAANESGLTIWFMKPDVDGRHHSLLSSIRQHFSRDVQRRWTNFLESYYLHAEKTQLTNMDLHAHGSTNQ